MVTFVIAQNNIRKEIKLRIKQSVPEEELILIALTQEEAASLQWLKSYEFRYRGGMYDIVRSHTSGDSVYYMCVNDVQEEQLFVNLHEQVERQMNDTARKGGVDAFKKALDSEPACLDGATDLACYGPVLLTGANLYQSINLDIPSPPPWRYPA